MSPILITALLWYHTRAPEAGDFDIPQEFMDTLVAWELIKVDPRRGEEHTERKWNITDRGIAHAQALCDLPLPIAKWITPPVNTQ